MKIRFPSKLRADLKNEFSSYSITSCVLVNKTITMLSKTLHAKGFLHLKNQLQVTPRVIRSLHTRTINADTIFNYNEHKDNDYLRLQAPIQPLETKGLTELVTAAENILRNNSLITDTHALKDWVLLISRKGCQSQHAHFDNDPQLLASLPDQQIPLALLVGVQDGGILLVWPRNMPEGSTMVKVEYNRGDLVIFRGDLKHAGAEYSNGRHMRLHCYIDHVCVPRQQNTTFHD